MSYWLGLFLLVSGVLSLVFNEFTVQVRRAWPWRRDDFDATRDAQLNEYYRLSVFAGSILSVEIGVSISGLNVGNWLLRVLVYTVFGGWLLWKRAALRRKQFWKNLLESE